ncbi:hypothetical protein KDA_76360 [Dictyobacter alpinus]|uniref:Uncharacterized protein n=2 Tax=Dictyobacter alpinus TaxID=2014873 RepID=A0A402BLE3_9CHLR|nr:hypothetical protein KDA_76360 [Dictyobacter alpinus]
MPETAVISEAAGTGYAYLVRIPYKHRLFITSFKNAVPEPGRDWHPRLSAWLFRRNYLSEVRCLTNQYAETEHWDVLDTTTMAKDQAAGALQELDRQEHEDHVARFLAVLPRIPANALILAGWLEQVIVLDLETYLGDELFRAWIRAGQPERKHASLPYISMNNSRTTRVVVAADSRILRAVLSRSIQRLQMVRDLTLDTVFEDGIIHWRDAQGKLWYGAPYQQALMQHEYVRALYQPSQTYNVAFSPDDQIYLVARAEALDDRFFAWGFNPHIGFTEGYKAPPTGFPLSTFLERYHLVDWFVTWAKRSLAKEECLPVERYGWHRSLWENRNYWIHPAQGLISLLLYHSEEETQAILGWSNDYVKEQHTRITHIKEQHAHHYLDYCRQHAIELALPKLQTKSKSELLAFGEQYGIQVRKSWTIQRLAQQLLSSGGQSVRLANAVLEIPEQQKIAV